MNLTFAANLTKMIDAGLGREAAPPETFVAVGRTTEYTDLGPVPIASFETNVEAPLRALTVAMEPIQAGTGDPSPENVRPITGRSSVKIITCGANIWDEEWELGSFNTTSGANVATTSQIRSKNRISITPNTEYYFLTNPSIWVLFYDADNHVVTDLPSGRTRDGNSLSIGGTTIAGPLFTTPATARSMKFYCQSSYGDEYKHDISINYPSTDNDYHPGTVASVEVQLGQTVYGGSLDVTTGVLTVDYGYIDLGTLNWTKYGSNPADGRFISSQPVPYPKTDGNGVCSAYSFGLASIPNIGRNLTIGVTSSKQFLICDKSYTDPSLLKTALSGVYAAYEINEPVTLQLTAQTITSLLGQNNVWSDGGDVSLTYGTTRYTEGY